MEWANDRAARTTSAAKRASAIENATGVPPDESMTNSVSHTQAVSPTRFTCWLGPKSNATPAATRIANSTVPASTSKVAICPWHNKQQPRERRRTDLRSSGAHGRQTGTHRHTGTLARTSTALATRERAVGARGSRPTTSSMSHTYMGTTNTQPIALSTRKSARRAADSAPTMPDPSARSSHMACTTNVSSGIASHSMEDGCSPSGSRTMTTAPTVARCHAMPRAAPSMTNGSAQEMARYARNSKPASTARSNGMRGAYAWAARMTALAKRFSGNSSKDTAARAASQLHSTSILMYRRAASKAPRGPRAGPMELTKRTTNNANTEAPK